MLPVQEAVKKSVKTFAELFPPDAARDLRLEEVSISEDERTWQVTLSYKNPDYDQEARPTDEAANNFLRAFTASGTGVSARKFKTVTLNAADGNLLSVKNA